MDKMQWIKLLKQDVVPALGCTEPVCVALCAAYAGQRFTGQPSSITVQTNAGIYKNGMSAGIPNCPQVGLLWAAAIGFQLKNPEKQLQLLEDVTQDTLAAASGLILEDRVCVHMDPNISELYVRCTLRGSRTPSPLSFRARTPIWCIWRKTDSSWSTHRCRKHAPAVIPLLLP